MQNLEQFFAGCAQRVNRMLKLNGAPPVHADVKVFADYRCADGSVRHGRRSALYRSLGSDGVRLARLDVTALDERRALACLRWDSRHLRPDGRRVRVAFETLQVIRADLPSLELHAA